MQNLLLVMILSLSILVLGMGTESFAQVSNISKAGQSVHKMEVTKVAVHTLVRAK